MPVFPMDFAQFQVQAAPARDDGGDGPGPGVKEKDSNCTNVFKLKLNYQKLQNLVKGFGVMPHLELLESLADVFKKHKKRLSA